MSVATTGPTAAEIDGAILVRQSQNSVPPEVLDVVARRVAQGLDLVELLEEAPHVERVDIIAHSFSLARGSEWILDGSTSTAWFSVHRGLDSRRTRRAALDLRVRSEAASALNCDIAAISPSSCGAATREIERRVGLPARPHAGWRKRWAAYRAWVLQRQAADEALASGRTHS